MLKLIGKVDGSKLFEVGDVDQIKHVTKYPVRGTFDAVIQNWTSRPKTSKNFDSLLVRYRRLGYAEDARLARCRNKIADFPRCFRSRALKQGHTLTERFAQTATARIWQICVDL